MFRDMVARGQWNAIPPDWYYPVAGFTSLASLLCLIAIWDFLKPGVIGLIALSVAGFVLSWNMEMWLLTFFGFIFNLIVLFIVIIMKWRAMRWLPAWNS